MAFHKGSGAICAIGKESVWGTAVADTLLINFARESLKLNVKKVEEDNLLTSKAPSAYDLMVQSIAGDIEGIIKPENAGFLMKAALGGTDTVTNPTGQYLHTIILATATGTIPSYTIFVDRKQAVKKYSGCKISTLKISAKAGDYVRFIASFKGKDEATGTITTTSVPSKKSYKFTNGTLTLGGASQEITAADLTIDNSLDDGIQTSASGAYMSEPVHETRKIRLEADIPYAAAPETVRETNYKTETVLATAVLHLESPEIIATTYKYRMDLTLNNVAVLDASINVGDRGLLSMHVIMEATAVSTTEPISAAIYDNANGSY